MARKGTAVSVSIWTGDEAWPPLYRSHPHFGADYGLFFFSFYISFFPVRDVPFVEFIDAL